MGLPAASAALVLMCFCPLPPGHTLFTLPGPGLCTCVCACVCAQGTPFLSPPMTLLHCTWQLLSLSLVTHPPGLVECEPRPSCCRLLGGRPLGPEHAAVRPTRFLCLVHCYRAPVWSVPRRLRDGNSHSPCVLPLGLLAARKGWPVLPSPVEPSWGPEGGQAGCGNVEPPYTLLGPRGPFR